MYCYISSLCAHHIALMQIKMAAILLLGLKKCVCVLPLLSEDSNSWESVLSAKVTLWDLGIELKVFRSVYKCLSVALPTLLAEIK